MNSAAEERAPVDDGGEASIIDDARHEGDDGRAHEEHWPAGIQQR